MRLYVFVPIFLSVIIEDFLSFLNIPPSHYKNTTFAYLDLSVRSARVIDIARTIVLWFAIDGAARIHFEKVFAFNRIFLFLRYGSSDIFDNAHALRHLFGSEKAETGARSLHGRPKSSRFEFFCSFGQSGTIR